MPDLLLCHNGYPLPQALHYLLPDLLRSGYTDPLAAACGLLSKLQQPLQKRGQPIQAALDRLLLRAVAAGAARAQVALMLTHGGSPATCSDAGDGPLHLIARHGHRLLLPLFLPYTQPAEEQKQEEAQAPSTPMLAINAPDSAGHTPLWLALMVGSEDRQLVRQLIAHGARLDNQATLALARCAALEERLVQLTIHHEERDRRLQGLLSNASRHTLCGQLRGIKAKDKTLKAGLPRLSKQLETACHLQGQARAQALKAANKLFFDMLCAWESHQVWTTLVIGKAELLAVIAPEAGVDLSCLHTLEQQLAAYQIQSPSGYEGRYEALMRCSLYAIALTLAQPDMDPRQREALTTIAQDLAQLPAQIAQNPTQHVWESLKPFYKRLQRHTEAPGEWVSPDPLARRGRVNPLRRSRNKLYKKSGPDAVVAAGGRVAAA